MGVVGAPRGWLQGEAPTSIITGVSVSMAASVPSERPAMTFTDVFPSSVETTGIFSGGVSW